MPILGPATAELRMCSSSECGDKAVCRGLCRRHYNQKWKVHQLPPKVERQKLVPATVRLPKAEYVAISKLTRVSGRTLASLVSEAVRDYLVKCNAWPVAG